MDFKGHVALRQGRLHPLTGLDDHSRFSLVLEACPDQTTETVKTRLIAAFRRYAAYHGALPPTTESGAISSETQLEKDWASPNRRWQRMRPCEPASVASFMKRAGRSPPYSTSRRT